MTGNETALRHRLGIPDDAARVLIFAESSHWDPNWLHTAEEYFRRWVGPNLDRALAELEREPRRIYSVECMFFLRMYWEARPEQQEAVRRLVNEGRLRLTSSGVTTADTLVPRSEAILRDWLVGQEWLRCHGMAQEPRLAYFTDSFGCSPALPSLLRAAGFTQTAITRVDGMYFVGTDFEPEQAFPRPGSTAERLAKQERTLDFLWRGPDGAEVLCHWNAFTYGQGDMLAHRGIGRMYIVPLAVSSRSERAVAQRIEGYVAQLAPLSRTPYLFCPIGFDFVGPIPDLVDLLDRYNARHYPQTGVWAVCAGLDDYLSLVDCHRSLLPALALDPNPYWTGFYTSRPDLKRKAHELVDTLLLAERLALQQGDEAEARATEAELSEAWWAATTANHHDFITGTSPDRVAYNEQHPMLDGAAQAARNVVSRLAPVSEPEPAAARPALPAWRREAGKIEVYTSHYTVELAEEAGGAIINAWDAQGQPLLAGVSGDLVSYRDAGGLWRMGHEFRGGELTEVARASAQPAALEVEEKGDELEVRCAVTLGGRPVVRRFLFRAGSPLVRLRVEGQAALRRTVTLSFATGLVSRELVMDQPGGVVTRPLVKVYEPTFWPLQSFLHAEDTITGRGIGLLLALPGAAAFRPSGQLEVVALRNATRELAWGTVPLLATPATGHVRGDCTFECALVFTPRGGWQSNELPQLAGALRPNLPELVHSDCPEVTVTAIKPASRGEGAIIRLSTLSAAGASLRLAWPGREVREAALCDARERDLAPLTVREGNVELTMPGNIATVRVLLA